MVTLPPSATTASLARLCTLGRLLDQPPATERATPSATFTSLSCETVPCVSALLFATKFSFPACAVTFALISMPLAVTLMLPPCGVRNSSRTAAAWLLYTLISPTLSLPSMAGSITKVCAKLEGNTLPKVKSSGNAAPPPRKSTAWFIFLSAALLMPTVSCAVRGATPAAAWRSPVVVRPCMSPCMTTAFIPTKFNEPASLPCVYPGSYLLLCPRSMTSFWFHLPYPITMRVAIPSYRLSAVASAMSTVLPLVVSKVVFKLAPVYFTLPPDKSMVAPRSTIISPWDCNFTLPPCVERSAISRVSCAL